MDLRQVRLTLELSCEREGAEAPGARAKLGHALVCFNSLFDAAVIPATIAAPALLHLRQIVTPIPLANIANATVEGVTRRFVRQPGRQRCDAPDP